MQTLFPLPILAFIVASNSCFGMMSIGLISKKEAKEMGIEFRATPNGPNEAWVRLQFKTEGKFKAFNHVSLEISDGKKFLLGYDELKENRTSSGSVVVSFLANRAYLENITLRIVMGSLSDVGYDLPLKDFVELKAAALAPTSEDEAQFVETVRKAFAARDPSVLAALTCWDSVTDALKERTQSGYAGLIAEKDCLFDFKLVEPERGFVDKDRTEDGLPHRPNLPVTRQLNVTCRNTADKKTLFRMCYAVGEKDGKLVLLALAPVK